MYDADASMRASFLPRFLDQIANGQDVVIGSRQIDGARRIGEPSGRHLMGRVFNAVVKTVAVGGFEDTQCGFKCFRGDVAEQIFRLQKTVGWGFDVEILFLATKRGYSVVEIPIDWHYEESSKIRPVADSVQMVKDTLLVRLRSILGVYR
jgi:hypothetical protein